MKVETLGRRVALWQKRLRLDHWEVQVAIVDEVDGKEGALAAATVSDYYDVVQFQFRREALDRGQREVDISIVHELMHVHFRDLDETFWQARKCMGRDLSDAMHNRYDHEVEGVVDRVARIIVDAHSG